MSRVVVWVSDFEMGTRIADAVTSLGEEAVFPQDRERSEQSLYEDAVLVIIDLSERARNALELVRSVRKNHPELRLVGIVSRVRKKIHTQGKEAGCDWVLPRSSLVRNLSTLLEKRVD
ncbi:MAG: hypothetical protein V3U24_05230 [Candidatus Neomarinimicrobiota bacterium]